MWIVYTLMWLIMLIIHVDCLYLDVTHHVNNTCGLSIPLMWLIMLIIHVDCVYLDVAYHVNNTCRLCIP